MDAAGAVWVGPSAAVAPPGGPKSFDFTFDRVFGQTDGQRAVFEDISHLVQSALDGYKVRRCTATPASPHVESA
jgi:kinesin family protein C1